MSEAREQKMKEWGSNIFSKSSQDEAPLFKTKGRSESRNMSTTNAIAHSQS